MIYVRLIDGLWFVYDVCMIYVWLINDSWSILIYLVFMYDLCMALYVFI